MDYEKKNILVKGCFIDRECWLVIDVEDCIKNIGWEGLDNFV